MVHHMAQLSARITKLESARPPLLKGLCLESLSAETRAAMALAYSDTLVCEAPDPDTYFNALLARMKQAQRTGQGIEALEDGDLEALILAYEMAQA
jgi:hypothetical protein